MFLVYLVEGRDKAVDVVPQPKEVEHPPDEQVFIAFARVFSGTVKQGATLYVLGPKHDPALVLEQVGVSANMVQTNSIIKICKLESY